MGHHLERNSSYEINSHLNSASNIISFSHRQISRLAIVTVVLIGLFFLGGYFIGAQYLSYWLSKQSTVTLHDAPIDCSKKNQPSYYAQLATFGSRHAATLFVDRLQQKKIIAKVVERKNETVSGKNIIWYQVITELFDTQQELHELLCKIEKEEKLNDSRIIVC